MKGKKLSAKERMAKLEKDAAERRRVFKELCDHLSKGYSLDCFPTMSDVTVRKFITLYPEEFVEEELVEAKRHGKLHWEGIGHRQALGSCLGNSRSWYYNMANRYGWREKVEIEAEHKGEVAINVISYATTKASKNDESND